MATIRERRPGVWEVRAFTGRDARGRPTQISRTVRGSRKAAERVAAELTVHPVGQSAGRRVSDAIDAWVELSTPTWAPSSRRDQTSRALHIKADKIATVPLARLTVADVERWHARLCRAGVGESAIVNRHRALRAALAQAVRWGWLSNNPASLARLGRAKHAPRGSLSADEVRRVLEAAADHSPHALLALRLAAVSGARRSELAALRWSDLRGDRLLIDGSVAKLAAGPGTNGAAGPRLIDAATKTANQRQVTLDAETCELWRRLEAERAGISEWVFSSDDQPANPDRIGWWWRQARRRSGIDAGWRLHDLRHWSATMAIRDGHDVRTVAGRLGHANAAMTLRVYAHALDGADAEVATTLGRALSQTSPPTPGDRVDGS